MQNNDNLKPLQSRKLRQLFPLLIVLVALGIKVSISNNYSIDHNITQHLEQEVIAIKDSLLCSVKSGRMVSLVKEIQADSLK